MYSIHVSSSIEWIGMPRRWIVGKTWSSGLLQSEVKRSGRVRRSLDALGSSRDNKALEAIYTGKRIGRTGKEKTLSGSTRFGTHDLIRVFDEYGG